MNTSGREGIYTKGSNFFPLFTSSSIFLLFSLGSSNAHWHNYCSDKWKTHGADESLPITCDLESISVVIPLCPIFHVGVSPSMLSLNGQQNRPACQGSVLNGSHDNSPSLLFHIGFRELEECGSSLEIVSMIGKTGVEEFGNISGSITTSAVGDTISYVPDLLYHYSCLYALSYLLSSAQFTVASAVISYHQGNGSFQSTLHLQLYNDSTYNDLLIIPQKGIPLKTRIFAALKATDLDRRWNVLMDHCFATPTTDPADKIQHDLFLRCRRDPQTEISSNGDGQMGRFSFELFRFLYQKHKQLTTLYLHCHIRLCHINDCHMRVCPNYRLRRSPNENNGEVAMVTAGPIIVGIVNVTLESQDKQHLPTTAVSTTVESSLGITSLSTAEFALTSISPIIMSAFSNSYLSLLSLTLLVIFVIIIATFFFSKG